MKEICEGGRNWEMEEMLEMRCEKRKEEKAILYTGFNFSVITVGWY